jgi:hypothetical protein
MDIQFVEKPRICIVKDWPKWSPWWDIRNTAKKIDESTPVRHAITFVIRRKHRILEI